MVKVPEIVSANEQLMPKVGVTKTGKRYSYMFMPPPVKKYKKDLIAQLTPQMPKNLPSGKVTIFTAFILNHSLITRDTDNMIKIYADSFKVALKLDDKYTYTHVLTKSTEQSTESEETIISFINVFEEI